MEDASGTAGYNAKDKKFYPYDSYEGGTQTVGFGHKIKEGEDFSSGLTQAERNKLLAADIKEKREELSSKYPDFKKLPKKRQDAIIAHTFQVGVNSFPKFKKAMIAGDIKTAKKEATVHVNGKPDVRRNKAYSDTWLND